MESEGKQNGHESWGEWIGMQSTMGLTISCWLGIPKCTVLVVSVVPSLQTRSIIFYSHTDICQVVNTYLYWAPVSSRKRPLSVIRALVKLFALRKVNGNQEDEQDRDRTGQGQNRTGTGQGQDRTGTGQGQGQDRDRTGQGQDPGCPTHL